MVSTTPTTYQANLNHVMHIGQSLLIVCVAAVGAGCGEEKAAKIAPWLGLQTLNEHKADIKFKGALRRAKNCRIGEKTTEQMADCMHVPERDVMMAMERYLRDCKYGNKGACLKADKASRILLGIDRWPDGT